MDLIDNDSSEESLGFLFNKKKWVLYSPVLLSSFYLVSVVQVSVRL